MEEQSYRPSSLNSVFFALIYLFLIHTIHIGSCRALTYRRRPSLGNSRTRFVQVECNHHDHLFPRMLLEFDSYLLIVHYTYSKAKDVTYKALVSQKSFLLPPD